MNLFFYILTSILIAMLIGYFLPRTAVAAGAVLLLAGLFFIGSCVYHELIITTPHDTSAYGMMATLSTITIVPMGIAMIVIGIVRKRMGG